MTNSCYLTIKKNLLLSLYIFLGVSSYAQTANSDITTTIEGANQHFLKADSLLKAGNISNSISEFEAAISFYKNSYGVNDDRFSNVYATIGQLMFDAGQQSLAIEYCNKAINLLKSNNSLSTYRKAKLYQLIAKSYTDQNLPSLSLEFFKESIAQFKSIDLGANQEDYLLTILQAGKLSYGLKHFENAIEYYNSALSLLNLMHLDKISPEHTIVYHNLGNCYLNLNNTDSALVVFQQGLEINQEIFGKNSNESIESYKNLVNTFFVAGNYEKTWESAHKVVELYHNLKQDNNVELLEFCSTLAKNHIHINAYHTASYWFKKYFEEKYNPYIPQPIESIDEFIKVGDLFMQRSTLTHGLIFYEEGLTYFEKLEKPNKETIADLSYSIGNVYWGMKRPFKAYKYYKKALVIFEHLEAEKAADCLAKLSNIYQKQGQRMAQLNSLIKSFDLLSKEGLKNQSAKVLKNIAETYYQYQQYDSALLYANKLAHTYESFTNHLEKKNAYILLANIYNAKKETSTAFEFYNKVLSSEPEVFEQQVDIPTLEANKNLSEIFSHTGDLDKAKKYAINAEKLRKKLKVY